MKQQDIALIIVIAFVSGIFSFILSDKIFVTPANRMQKVEVVDKLTSTFTTPNATYFNSSSINPTPNSSVGTGGSGDPFSQ